MKKSIIIVFLGLGLFGFSKLHAQCPSGYSKIVVKITTKDYGNEVHWKVKLPNGQTLDSAASSTYQSNKTYYDTICVQYNVRYSFEAWDAWGDGWGGGTYVLIAGGNTLADNNGQSPSDGVNQNGVDTIETVEYFTLKIDTLPDVALYSIVNPSGTQCGIGNFSVSARIKVVDSVPVDTLIVNYKLDNNSAVNQKFGFSNALKQDSIVGITFSQNLAINSYGNHTLSVWTDLPLDSVYANDSQSVSIFIDSSKSAFPKVESVENMNICGNQSSSCIGNNTCNLNSIWRNQDNDDTNWSVDSGDTESNGTGPGIDHTKANFNGKYLFVESSGCSGQSAILQASCLDLSQMSSPYLYFWYHMYGAKMGNLYIEIDTNGTWIILDSLKGQQQTSDSSNWLPRLVDLSNFKTSANIRLRAVTGTSFTSDMAIDDIEIRNFNAKDLLVNEVITPSNTSCGDSNMVFRMVVTNLGLNSASSFNATLQISGDQNINKTVTYGGNLAFGERDTILFSDINLFNGGNLLVKAYTSLQNDVDLTNDTANTSVSIVSFPILKSVSDTGRCGRGAMQLVSNSGIGDTTFWYANANATQLLSQNDTLTANGLTSDTTFYFRNKALSGNCYTTIQSVNIEVNHGLQSGITPQFPSRYWGGSQGLLANDTILEGDTIFYQVNVPTGYQPGDYGTTWVIDRIVAETQSGNPPTDSTFVGIGSSGPGLQIIATTNDVDSSYQIDFTLRDLASNCDTVLSRQIIVKALPSASFIADSVCEGTTTQFANQSSVASGSLNYLWVFGDGDSASTAQVQHTYLNAGSYTAKLYVTSDFGIQDSFERTVVVHGVPSANFSAQNECLYDSVSFLNTSALLGGNLNFNWSFGDSETSTQEDVNHIYADTGNYDVQLIATSAFTCIDTVIKTVRVYEVPVANFSLANVCHGDSARFIDNSTAAGSYSWTLGSATSTQQSPSLLFDSVGTYHIVQIITSDDNCLDTATSSLTVYPLPNIQINANDICSYDSLTVDDLSSNVSSYSWSWGDGTTSNTAYAKHKYNAPGNYQVKLTGVSQFSCVASDSFNVTVNAQPTASFSANSVCAGDTTEFSNQSSITAGFISSQWSFGDNTTSNEISPRKLFDSTGTYQVQLVTTSLQGCADSATRDIVVNANPRVDFSVNTICTGDTNSFQNNSSGAAGYVWYFGNGDSSTLQSPQYTYLNAGTYALRLKATSSKGCVSNKTSQEIVYQAPSSIFSVNNACEDDTLALNNFSSNGNSHQWSFGDGDSSVLSNPVKTYQNSGSYSIKLVVSGAGGCRDSSTKTVSIYGKPSVSFNTANICLGDTAFFQNNSTGANSYLWSFGNGFNSSLNNPNMPYGNTGTFSVKLIATALNNCADSMSKSIQVFKKPSISFTSNTNVCEGENINLSNNSTGGNTWLWKFGTGDTAHAYNAGYSFDTSGTFYVSLRGSSGQNCSAKDSTQITVNPKPRVSFSSVNACLGQTSLFANNTIIANGSLSHSWDFGDGTGSSARTSPGYQYATSGIYAVTLTSTSNKGCRDSLSLNDTVFALPLPSFSANNVCLGDSTQFSNNSSNTTFYQWKYGDGNNSTSAQKKHLYATSGTYTAILVAESVEGCLDSTSRTISVYSLPKVSFTSGDVCHGDSSTFVNGSSNANSYLWTFRKGAISTINSPKFLFSNTGEKTVKLVATNANGCVDSTELKHQVFELPNASFSANDTCLGDTTFFRNNSSSEASRLWNFGDGTTSNLRQPRIVFTNDSNYRVELVVYSVNGCSDTSLQSVKVRPLPQAQFAKGNICLGDSVKFINQSSGSTAYVWQLGDGRSSLSTSFHHTYSKTGTYKVQLKAINQFGCTDSIGDSVMVFDLPKAAFTTGSVCLGDTAIFNNGSTNTTRVNWHFGDGSTSTGINPKHVYRQSKSFNIQLVAYSANNCTDTISKTTDVKPIPLVQIKADSVLCAGDTLPLFNNTSGAQGFNWEFGSQAQSTDSLPIVSFSQHGPIQIAFTATSSSQCKAHDTLTLRVKASPVASFISNNVCLGDTTFFINQSGIAKGNLQYQWDLGDGKTTSFLSSLNLLRKKASIFSVKLVAVSNEGCGDSVTINDTAFALPIVNFRADTVCLTDSTSLSNLSNANQYQWTLGTAKSQRASPKYVFATAGSHLVKLIGTSSDGCVDSLQKVVKVNALPKPLFGYSNVCLGDTTTYTNFSTNASSFTWKFGNGQSSSQTQPKYVYANSGSYLSTLVARSSQGCVDSIQQTVQVYANPTASFSANDTCLGDTSRFTNLSATNLTYDWNLGDGRVSTDYSLNHAYSSAGTYTVRLIVITSRGCRDTVQQNVIVHSNPVAGFSNQDVCLNDSAQFTNTSLGASTFVWDFGDATKAIKPSPSKLYSTTGTYSVLLEAYSVQGCSDSISKNIAVNALPNVAFNGDTVCFGLANTFTNTSGNAVSYQWLFGSPGAADTARNTTHIYADSGYFDVQLIAFTAFGCVDTANDRVRVYGRPDVDFNERDACVNESIAFRNTKKATKTMLWNFGNGDSTIFPTINYQFKKAGTYQVSLTALNSLGCTNTVSKDITIAPYPIAGFSKGVGCLGSPFKFDNTTDALGQEVMYFWDFGDSTGTSTAQNPNYHYTRVDTYHVKLKATTPLGCNDSLIREIPVYKQPKASYLEDLACENQIVEFLPGSVNPAIKHEWIIDNDTVVSDTLRYIFRQPGSYRVTLRASADPACFDRFSKMIDVGASPEARFIGDLKVCQFSEVEFLDLSSITGREPLNYRWKFGNGKLSTEQDPIEVFDETGEFRVKQLVSTDFGCSDSFEREITVLKTPDVDIGYEEIGAFVYFHPGDTTADKYYWDFGNGATSRFKKPRNLYNENGRYYINLIAANENGCEAEVSKVITLTSTNIAENPGSMISAYPNPFKNEVRLILPESTYSRQLELFTMSGKVIWQGSASAGQQNVLIETASLPTGVFYLKVTGSHTLQVLPLIKE